MRRSVLPEKRDLLQGAVSHYGLAYLARWRALQLAAVLLAASLLYISCGDSDTVDGRVMEKGHEDSRWDSTWNFCKYRSYDGKNWNCVGGPEQRLILDSGHPGLHRQ